ncbi:spore protease YyaC [Clostridium lundense]|uniref:spore protease YyaC n=1 Tax=Clostridium lundense TaxID=319475 RepID=UPI000481E148|nr:spore protease YyaC [Clostridium lundense]
MDASYFYAFKEDSVNEISKYIFNMINGEKKILILCIGTDMCTGDSFGPLTGTLLRRNNCPCTVIGDLENIVHYNNLKETIKYIRCNYEDYFIIAIDASLGDRDNIGKITIEKGSIFPATALRSKNLSIGDIAIKAIVNRYSSIKSANEYILQQTRLYHVYSMAEILSNALLKAINNNLIQCENLDTYNRLSAFL